jgi:phosphoserine phosphatase
MNKTVELKYVILDLDQTLTVDQGSWTQFTTLLGADARVHLEIFNEFKTGELTYREAKKNLIDLWKSVSRLDRRSIEEIFEKIELREGALEALEYLKTKYKLCIISGAIDVFVDVVSKKLEIEDRYASTKFIFDQDNVLTDFQYILSRGEEKVKFFNEFCSKYNINPIECCAIGDGESDIPIFEKVGLPILFVAFETTLESKEKVQIHLSDWKDIKKFL